MRKIAFVTWHHCSRVKKEAAVLKKSGYSINLITNNMGNLDFYDSVHWYSDSENFTNAVSLLKNSIDIWHVHNQPNWMVTAIRNEIPKAKIIMDCHDLNVWLSGQLTVDGTIEKVKWYEEEVALLCADVMVVPSPACKDQLKKCVNRPVIYVPSASPLDWYRNGMYGYRGGLVIEGGVSMATDHKLDNWRNYTQLIKDVKNRSQVYVYSPAFTFAGNDKLLEHYASLGAQCNKVNHDVLLDRLREHTWNVVGNIAVNPMHDALSLQNKFFDGIASGVPAVVFNLPEVENIVNKYDIGIVVKTIDELYERWDEHIGKRKNLMLCRKELSMEKFIKPLIKAYEEL